MAPCGVPLCTIPPAPAPKAATHLLSSVFFLSRPTPPRIRRKIPAADQRPCLASMKPNSPALPIPQVAGSRTPPSPDSSDFGPKQPKPEGPHPKIELIKPAAAPPTGPNPFLATPGIATTRGCTGSKLGFHSYPPQIRKAITTPKPNTMLIKSATRGPGKSSCQIQGNEDQSFKGKRLLKPQKAAKPSPKLPLWPQPTSAQPPATTALLKRPRAGYPTMDAQPVGWESGGLQARGRSATCPGFG